MSMGVQKGGKQCGEHFFLEDASFCFLDVSQNSEDSGVKLRGSCFIILALRYNFWLCGDDCRT